MIVVLVDSIPLKARARLWMCLLRVKHSRVSVIAFVARSVGPCRVEMRLRQARQASEEPPQEK